MRAITIWQPYASAIALGLKRHETRAWRPRLRPRDPMVPRALLAIHAAKAPFKNPFEKWLARTERFLGPVGKLPRGAVVAVVRVQDLVQSQGDTLEYWDEEDLFWGDFTAGRWAWRLEVLVNLADHPVPCRGAQGLWRVPDDVQRRIFEACGDLLGLTLFDDRRAEPETRV